MHSAHAGPPSRLAVTLASHVQHGAAGTLGALTVRCTDAWGNAAAPPKPLEVTLRPAALEDGASGRSAKVTAKGSNRAKLVDGEAAFQDVCLKGDADGAFKIVVYSKCRSPVCSVALSVIFFGVSRVGVAGCMVARKREGGSWCTASQSDPAMARE